MKTSPWFSKDQTDAPYHHDETVYHENTLCADGQNVIKKHLVFGTGHRPLCKKCAQLNAAEVWSDLCDPLAVAANGTSSAPH